MHLKPLPGLLILLSIAALPMFAHLDELPLYQWDESRLAISALEMLHNHNWLVVHCAGKPEMWSTKPPLMIWTQVLTMKMLGVNELAVRLPAALAGLGTCIMLYFFFARKFKEPLLGLLCAGVLITTQGYIADHATRHGDYDALLTMFMMGYCLSFYLFLDDGRRRYLYTAFAFIIFAALTKGVQSFLFMPAVLIYTVYRRKAIVILKRPDLYIGIAIILFVVIGYYVLREQYNPGYISAVVENELGGRYNKVVEGHYGKVWFYFALLTRSCFHEWYLYVIPGIIVGIFSHQTPFREISLYSFLLVITYLAIVSFSQTKLPWYATPLYPFLSILAGVFIFSVCNALYQANVSVHANVRHLLPVSFLLVVFSAPYILVLNKVLSPRSGLTDPLEEQGFAMFLREAIHNRKETGNTYYILNNSDQQNFYWYYCVLARRGTKVEGIDSNNIKTGMNIIPYGTEAQKYIDDNFRTTLSKRYRTVNIFTVLGRKDAMPGY